MVGPAIDGAPVRQHSAVRRRRHCVFFLSVVAAQVCLSGCAHYFYVTANDFNRGGVSEIQFQRDNTSCQTKAAVRQNEVGGGDPHGIYNEAYLACMNRRGYATNNVDLLGIGG